MASIQTGHWATIAWGDLGICHNGSRHVGKGQQTNRGIR